jgi:membrane-associated phospholipid phosphatase
MLSPPTLALVMARTWGITEWLREVLPPVVRSAFAVLTQLGDAWFFFVVLTLLYWFGDDRRRWGFVIGATLGALSLTLALKGLFAFPRPPADLQFVHADGYGFPSGHAVGATVVWGLLALSLDRSHHRVRVAVAALVVLLVTFSRLAIGVHFFVDVLVGIAVGLVYLAVVVVGLDWRPTPAFALAAALAGVSVVTTGGGIESVATFGGSLGALVAWRGLDVPTTGRMSPVAGVVGLGAIAALSYAGLRLSLPLPAVFAVNVAAQGGLLAYPALVARVE